jgi:hypothetical protein
MQLRRHRKTGLGVERGTGHVRQAHVEHHEVREGTSTLPRRTMTYGLAVSRSTRIAVRWLG